MGGGVVQPMPQRRPFSRPARNYNQAKEAFRQRDEHALNDINEYRNAGQDAFDAASTQEAEISGEDAERMLEAEILSEEAETQL